MTFKQAIETTVDISAQVGVLRAGMWSSEQSQAIGEKPQGEFTLRMKFSSISENNLLDIHGLFDASDWSVAASGDDFYVTSSGNVARTPACPSPLHSWNWSTFGWQDMRPLSAVREAAWTAMKLAREAAIDAPLVTPWGTVDCKAKDRTNITDAVLMLQTLQAIGTPTTIDFTMADNTTATLTTTQMVTVGLLLGQKVQTAHSRARVLRTAIESATTKEEIEAITW